MSTMHVTYFTLYTVTKRQCIVFHLHIFSQFMLTFMHSYVSPFAPRA